MRTADQWFTAYAVSHTHPFNVLMHWICVPLIVVSVVGLLWSLPVPADFSAASPALNWGALFLLAAVVYYFIMSVPLAFGILPFIVAVVAAVVWLESLAIPLWGSSLAIFIVAWIGQFIGHWVEGKRPSFFEDAQFLMIGPLWLLSKLFRRAGLPY